MKKAVVYVVLSVLLFSCGSGDRLPSGILPREKMEAMLWDFMRADFFVKDYVLAKDSSLNAGSEQKQVFQRVLDFHNVTQPDFRKSLDYYMKHTDLMKKVLDSIQTYAQKEAELYATPKLLIDTSFRKAVRDSSPKDPEDIDEHIRQLKKRDVVSGQVQ